MKIKLFPHAILLLFAVCLRNRHQATASSILLIFIPLLFFAGLSNAYAQCTSTEFRNIYQAANTAVRATWEACGTGRRAYQIEVYGRCGGRLCSLGVVKLTKRGNSPPFFRGTKRQGNWVRQYFVQRLRRNRI